MGRERAALLTAMVLLALAVVVAAGSTGIEWTPSDRTVTGERAPEQGPTGPPGPQEPEEESPESRPDRPDDSGGWQLTLGGVLSILALAALVITAGAVLVRLRLRLRLRRRRLTARLGIRGGAEPAGSDELPEAEEIAAALDAGVAALEEGTPRNAVVAAWVALERALEAAGVERVPADTATDLVTRTLAAYDLDAEALGRLAGLYREARFSRHDLTAGHRIEAEQCLDLLRRQLRAGVRR